MVDLRKDRAHVREMWRSSDDSLVPLPLAAALVFHELHEAEYPVVPRPEYEDALNLVAAALSRLLEIHTVGAHADGPVGVPIHVGNGRFRDGASRFERHDGQVLGSLAVPRERVAKVLPHVRAAGIPFRFTPGSRSAA